MMDLQIENQTITLGSEAVECVSYFVTIRPSQSKRRSVLVAHNAAIAIALEWFLLRPNMVEPSRRTRLHFTLPHGIKVSAPGSVLPSPSGKQVFELLRRPIDWDGNIAFGELTQSVVE